MIEEIQKDLDEALRAARIAYRLRDQAIAEKAELLAALEEARHALAGIHGLYLCDGVNAHEERLQLNCSSVLDKLNSLLPPLPPAITGTSKEMRGE